MDWGIFSLTMNNQQSSTREYAYEAEVIESSVIDESILRKILIKAGRTIAQPALEAFEMIVDPSTLDIITIVYG